jgi:hypothetical protein
MKSKIILDLSARNAKLRLKEALGDYSAIRTVKYYIYCNYIMRKKILLSGKVFYVKTHLVTINTFYIYCNVNCMCFPECVVPVITGIFCKIKKMQMLFQQNVHRVNMCIIILYYLILLNST